MRKEILWGHLVARATSPLGGNKDSQDLCTESSLVRGAHMCFLTCLLHEGQVLQLVRPLCKRAGPGTRIE